MTTQLEQAARLALEALETSGDDYPALERKAITAIRAALEHPSNVKQVIELYDSPEQPAQKGCMRCNTPKKCAVYGCSPLTWPAEQPAQDKPVTYTGNGTSSREADVRPTGFFFQMPRAAQDDVEQSSTERKETFLQPLTQDMVESCPYEGEAPRSIYFEGWLKAEAAHGIKGEA